MQTRDYMYAGKVRIRSKDQWDILDAMTAVRDWLVRGNFDMDLAAPTNIVFVDDRIGVRIVVDKESFWLTVLFGAGPKGYRSTEASLAKDEDIKEYNDPQWQL